MESHSLKDRISSVLHRWGEHLPGHGKQHEADQQAGTATVEPAENTPEPSPVQDEAASSEALASEEKTASPGASQQGSESPEQHKQPAVQGKGFEMHEPDEAPSPESEQPPSSEPERLGAFIPATPRSAGRQEDVVESLREALEVVERAGQMIEAQAKRQQQIVDLVADLPTRLSSVGESQAELHEQVHRLRQQIERHGEQILDHQRQMESLADATSSAEETFRTSGARADKLTDEIQSLVSRIEQHQDKMSQRYDSMAQSVSEGQGDLSRHVRNMQRFAIAAIVAAAVAIVLVVVAVAW